MTAVFVNDFHRMKGEKTRILLVLALTAFAIVAALFFSSRPAKVGRIALVAAEGQSVIQSDLLEITVLGSAPPLSQLVSNRYDAIVQQNSDGSWDITTVKAAAFRGEVESILQNPGGDHTHLTEGRGPGGTIIGFLTMLVMMQGVSLMFLFSDDKEKKQIERVAAAPISFTGYLCAHGLFTFLCIWLPALLLLSLAALLPGVNLGLALWQHALLLALLSALSVSFSMLLNALFLGSDRANLAGSAIVVLTSVLAGGFYAFHEGNPALDAITRVLPQKAVLNLVDGIESGLGMESLSGSLLLVAALIVGFALLAVLKTRRDYVARN